VAVPGAQRVAQRRRRRPTAQAAKPKSAASELLARYRLLPVIALVALTVLGSVLAVGTVHVKVLLCVCPTRDRRGRVVDRPCWSGLGSDTSSSLVALLPIRVFRVSGASSAVKCASRLVASGGQHLGPRTCAAWRACLVAQPFARSQRDRHRGAEVVLLRFDILCRRRRRKRSEPPRRANHRLRLSPAGGASGARAPLGVR